MRFALIQLSLLHLIQVVLTGRSRDPHAVRFGRSLYEHDSANQQHKPDLIARHEKNYTFLNCTIQTPRPHTEVFVNCPAFGNTRVPTICFQGCQPTKVCGTSSGLSDGCVPNEKTVFCQKSHSPNGTMIVQLRINRSDPRLAGAWWCTHAGLESAKFEIGLEKTVHVGDTKTAEIAKRDSKTPNDYPAQELRLAGSDQMDNRPLAYMRKPEVVLTVLTVLGLSLIINIAFCVRCLMLRLYFDATNEGSRNAKCLGRCLCLPKTKRKASALRMTPMLPRSINWADASNLNGSYHESAHMFYPSPNMSKMPLLMGHQSLNDVSGMQFYPTGSLPGTLRRHGPTSIPVGATSSSIGQLDMSFNQPLVYPSSVEHGVMIPQSPGYHGNPDMNLLTNYMPSYVRVPSINAPSPNPSQRMMAINHSTGLYHQHNTIPPGSFTPLNIGTPTSAHFIMGLQPTINGRQVVYDEVAAGTSSMAGNYNRSPNGSVTENPTVIHHFQHVPQNQLPRAHALPESSPLIAPELGTGRANGEFPFRETSHCVTQSAGATETDSLRSHPAQHVPQTVGEAKNEMQQRAHLVSNGSPPLAHPIAQRTGNQQSVPQENRQNPLPVNGIVP